MNTTERDTLSVLPTERVEPIEAGSRAGDVVVVMSPDVARAIAGMWATAHSSDPARGLARPDWPHEVVEIYEASVSADLDRGNTIQPFQPVPFQLIPVGGAQ
jgi:hypothetical protein